MEDVKTLDISFPLWKWDGIVIVGGTAKQFQKWAEDQFGYDVHTFEGSIGHAFIQRGDVWLLWLAKLTMPELAHEGLHIVSGMLEFRGLKFSIESEEAFTYTLELLIRTVLDPKAKWRPSKWNA